MNAAAVRTPRQLVWRRFKKNKRALACIVALAVMGIATLIIPLASLHDYREQDYDAVKVPPNSNYWMGTDNIGRDLFSRVFMGGRVSFQVALMATFISVAIGVAFGAISGYVGGMTDRLMMGFVNVLYAMPLMLVVVIVMAFMDKRSLSVVFIVLGLFGWLTMARIVRGQVLSLKERDYVTAARAMGANPAWIILKHMIPNVMGPVIVYATLMIPSLMLSESFLSFLGLGVSEPETSWGVLISEGANALSPIKSYWWMVAFPGACLAVTLFCLNAVGDGLRDAFDVRSND
jgi:oligopeptide transport system permease protein